jgi:hypothetical protein
MGMEMRLKIACVVAVVFLMYPFRVHAIPTVDLAITDPGIVAGVPFDIQVWAYGIVDDNLVDGTDNLALAAFGFDYSLPAGLTLSHIAYGPGLDDIAAFLTDTDVAGLADPFTLPLSGDVLLATLTFEALSAGDFAFLINTDSFGTGEEGLFITNLDNPFDFREYDISAQRSFTVSAASVPEPGTLVLFGIGILLLAALERRRRAV